MGVCVGVGVGEAEAIAVGVGDATGVGAGEGLFPSPRITSPSTSLSPTAIVIELLLRELMVML